MMGKHIRARTYDTIRRLKSPPSDTSMSAFLLFLAMSTSGHRNVYHFSATAARVDFYFRSAEIFSTRNDEAASNRGH